MKKEWKVLALGLISVLLFSTSACEINSERERNHVKVTLLQSDDYTLLEGEGCQNLKIGDTARFRVSVKDGYYVSSVNFPDYQLENCTDGSVRVVLKNVSYSMRVS